MTWPAKKNLVRKSSPCAAPFKKVARAPRPSKVCEPCSSQDDIEKLPHMDKSGLNSEVKPLSRFHGASSVDFEVKPSFPPSRVRLPSPAICTRRHCAKERPRVSRGEKKKERNKHGKDSRKGKAPSERILRVPYHDPALLALDDDVVLA